MTTSSRCRHGLRTSLQRAACGRRSASIIALPDTPAFVGALFGILRHGAVVVMVNPELPAEQLRYFFEYTRARAAFVHRATARGVHDAPPRASRCAEPSSPVRTPEFRPGAGDGARRLSRLSDRIATMPRSGCSAAARPAGRRRSCRPTARSPTPRSSTASGVLGPHARTTSPCRCRSCSSATPPGSNLFFPFSVGASVRAVPRALHARRALRATSARIARRCSSTCRRWCSRWWRMPDAAHCRTCRACGWRRRRARRCRSSCTIAGTQAFGVELLDGLGTAEMWHIFISNRPGDVVPGTLGRVVPGFEVKLCDDDGREVPDGEVGALWVKGDSRAIGYWQQHGRHDATRSAASGTCRATCSAETPTARSPTAAAPTTC